MNTHRLSASERGLKIFFYIVLSIVSIICALPFILVISGSFSDSAQILKSGYSIVPRGFSLDGYRSIFLFPAQIAKAYGVSLFVTVAGTGIGLMVMTLCGYAISRSELKYRNVVSFMIYFTTLFSGGLVPWYIVVTKLGLKDSIWALIIPAICSSFYILLIRNFMKTIPEALVESARIEGAGEFRTLLQIVVPMSKPILATIALFLALSYWNDWYLASLYVTKADLWPLQYRLYNILNAASKIASVGAENFTGKILPTETQKLANAIVATGPIIFLYPFLQKYFVQGISIGAVKG
ncbi:MULTISPECIES: carbohydrate ABC transporter permease [Paenibacillus]|uniref:Sugar ABC transporter permease n=1 Tax=Paenibacillus radicis (ex Gao et al. 2016) TaxID=1737354 RepID=A0A917GXM9_9BACL|nr:MULTISPECIES: carbohydrate ABC transporter permease [Paenibacillus]GGG60330.1 sugar ABC transporter permease [Paenibacillus radicis (ex Gao et al. 2016)]